MKNGGSITWKSLKILSKDVEWIHTELRTDLDYVNPLIKLFEKR